MNSLPDEVLEEVLWNLPPLDRLDSGVTCRRWAEAISSSTMLKDVWFSIRGFELEVGRAALLESHRQYVNLRLSRVYLSTFDHELWTKVGENLRGLELSGCDWSAEVLHNVLQSCSKLECLRVLYCHIKKSSIPTPTPAVPDGPEASGASRSNVRHLHLSGYVTGDMLAHLLRSMPNVTTISLSISICDSQFARNLPEMLGTARKITNLDLRPNTNFTETMDFVKQFAKNLRELRFDRHHNRRGRADLCCTEPRAFIVNGRDDVGDCGFRTVLLDNPELEVLDLSTCESCADKSCMILQRSCKLQELSLRFPGRNFTDEFYCSLGKISTLRCLSFYGSIGNAEAFRSIASLPNLHTLRVDYLHSRSLDVILENLENLQSLELGNHVSLNDSDLVKLSHFKRLRRLSFECGSNLTDRAFEQGLGSPSMEFLAVDFDSLTTDVGLASIATHHRRLRTFILRGGERVTVPGLANLLRSQPLLRELEILQQRLSDKLLEELMYLCPRLRVLRCGLDLGVGRPCLTDEALRLFRSRRPTVEMFYRRNDPIIINPFYSRHR